MGKGAGKEAEEVVADEEDKEDDEVVEEGES